MPTDECSPEIIRDVSEIGFVLANMTSTLILAFEKCRFEVGFIFPKFQGGSTLQSAVYVLLSWRIDRKRPHIILPLVERQKKVQGFFFPLFFLPSLYNIFNFLNILSTFNFEAIPSPGELPFLSRGE